MQSIKIPPSIASKCAAAKQETWSTIQWPAQLTLTNSNIEKYADMLSAEANPMSLAIIDRLQFGLFALLNGPHQLASLLTPPMNKEVFITNKIIGAKLDSFITAALNESNQTAIIDLLMFIAAQVPTTYFYEEYVLVVLANLSSLTTKTMEEFVANYMAILKTSAPDSDYAFYKFFQEDCMNIVADAVKDRNIDNKRPLLQKWAQLCRKVLKNTVIDIFEAKLAQCNRDRPPPMEPTSYWSLNATSASNQALVPDIESFTARFSQATYGFFDKFDWNKYNIVTAGGLVERCMRADVPIDSFDESDIDLFLYGSPEEVNEAKLWLFGLFNAYDNNGLTKFYVNKGSVASVYLRGALRRKIQVVFNTNNNPASIINGFDNGPSQVFFDGRNVFGTYTFSDAMSTGVSHVNMQTTTITRCIKLMTRGYRIRKIDAEDLPLFNKLARNQESKVIAVIKDLDQVCVRQSDCPIMDAFHGKLMLSQHQLPAHDKNIAAIIASIKTIEANDNIVTSATVSAEACNIFGKWHSDYAATDIKYVDIKRIRLSTLGTKTAFAPAITDQGQDTIKFNASFGPAVTTVSSFSVNHNYWTGIILDDLDADHPINALVIELAAKIGGPSQLSAEHPIVYAHAYKTVFIGSSAMPANARNLVRSNPRDRESFEWNLANKEHQFEISIQNYKDTNNKDQYFIEAKKVFCNLGNSPYRKNKSKLKTNLFKKLAMLRSKKEESEEEEDPAERD
jgi:hypothetical protein